MNCLSLSVYNQQLCRYYYDLETAKSHLTSSERKRERVNQLDQFFQCHTDWKYGPTRSPQISTEEDEPDEVDAAAQPRCNQWAHIDLNLSRNLTPAERRITREEERRDHLGWNLVARSLRRYNSTLRHRSHAKSNKFTSETSVRLSFSGFDKVIKFRQGCLHLYE